MIFTTKQKFKKLMNLLTDSSELAKLIDLNDVDKYLPRVSTNLRVVWGIWYSNGRNDNFSFMLRDLASAKSGIQFSAQIADGRLTFVWLENSKKLSQIIKEGIDFKGLEIERVDVKSKEFDHLTKFLAPHKPILDDVSVSDVNLLDLDEIDGDLYSLVDFGDGNFLVVSPSKEFHLVGHDLDSAVLVASNPEELIELGGIEYAKKKFDLIVSEIQ